MKRPIAILLLLLSTPSCCSWICATPSVLDTEYRDKNVDLRNQLVAIIQRAPANVTVEELELIQADIEACEAYEKEVWQEEQS